jgi:hypothetical protein
MKKIRQHKQYHRPGKVKDCRDTILRQHCRTIAVVTLSGMLFTSWIGSVSSSLTASC